MGCNYSNMTPKDNHVKACIQMLSKPPKTSNYQHDLDWKNAIDNCFASDVFGGSIFEPIGSNKMRGKLRHKSNDLETEIKSLSIDYLYGGGYYEFFKVQHNSSEDVDSE